MSIFLNRSAGLTVTNFSGQACSENDSLPEYLVRYVIMYFDYIFTSGTAWEEYIRNFMDSRRQYIPPKSGKKMTLSEISTVFGVTRAELSELSKDELKRLFRKKARKLHPDKGGSHEEFIELANAYKDIIRSKR